MGFKIGFSYDVHQLVENRPLVLGGVEIEHQFGLLGHSDADCLIHAIAEAIIGALGLGDLGRHFSDQDPKYKDINSTYFLFEVKKMLKNENYRISNIDSTINIEKPHIAKYIPKMQEVIAKCLEINPSLVNIKATRGEGLGFVGGQEGVACYAVVLIEKIESKIIKI